MAGEFAVPAPTGAVYGFLTDSERLLACMPDLLSREVQAPDHLVFTVGVRIGLLELPLTLDVETIEKIAPRQVTLSGKGRIAGSTVDVRGTFRLEEVNEGASLVRWEADAAPGARLMSLVGGAVEPLVQRYVARFVEAVKTEMSASAGPT